MRKWSSFGNALGVNRIKDVGTIGWARRPSEVKWRIAWWPALALGLLGGCATEDEPERPPLPGFACEEDCDGRCDEVTGADGARIASLCALPCDSSICGPVLGGVCDGEGFCVIPCDDAPCLWELECYLMGNGERRCLRSESP